MKKTLLYIALIVYGMLIFSGCADNGNDDITTTAPTTDSNPAYSTTLPSSTTIPTSPQEIVHDSFLISQDELQILSDPYIDITNMEVIKVYDMGLVLYGRCQPDSLDRALKRNGHPWNRFVLLKDGKVIGYKQVEPDTKEAHYYDDWDTNHIWYTFYVYAKSPQDYFDFPYTVKNVYCCDDGRSVAFIYYVTEQGNYFLYTPKYDGEMYLIPEDVFQEIAKLGVEKLDATPEDYAGYNPVPERLWDLTPYKVEPKA